MLKSIVDFTVIDVCNWSNHKQGGECFKRRCQTALIGRGMCQWICISQQDPVKGWGAGVWRGGAGGYGKTPMNWTKPTEIFSVMKAGRTVVARQMASKVCLMSEAWVSAELLHNSTPLVQRAKDSSIHSWGEGAGERWTAWRIQGRKHA